MSNIKRTFDSFINEELNKETYLSAADKLGKMGHEERASELEKHARSFDDTGTVTINGVKYDMNESNIQVDDKFKTLNIKLFNVDQKADERLISINYKSDEVKVHGIDGVENRKQANNIFNFVKKVVNKNVDKYPSLEDLLTKLKVNNLYKD